MTLQIVTFKWGSRYTADHVVRLRNMLYRNLTIPWEFVVITDAIGSADEWAKTPELEGIVPTRFLPLWNEMRDTKGCGVRIPAFAPHMREFIGPRFAWIDLDVVITGNVDHIFGRTEDFIALRPPQGPLAYQGSLVMMDAGAAKEVYEHWTPSRYEALKGFYAGSGMLAGEVSDEGWMTYVLGSERPAINGGWGKREDGVYFFRKDLARGLKPLPEDARMVIMNGRANDPSFGDLQRKCGWIREHWR